ncbi:MAG: hypothetical protein A2X58_08725 [Nitrospirae bacterium GWC2_56_14]|nr:MAG: hypothetical protein A2X58_08725 [Nitrospirae bacterium GWC2_56_14]
MSEELHFLHLEDNPTDAALIAATLEEEWPDCTVERVDSESAFVSALERGGIDLILADFSLPLYDGMSALAIARRRFPDLPLIFVSGTLGEEKAIESMKSGAVDYVLKNSIVRLVPAIRRALKDKEALGQRRKAEESLRESNERFRMIFEHSIDAIMLTSPDGRILAANPESCHIFGMSEEELCRSVRSDLVDMEDDRILSFLEERERTGRSRGEITMKRGDGSRFPAEISSSVFFDEKGNQKTSLIIRDVTERKSLENQLLHSQKMEAVGTLAGGIAHDFNNILTSIIGYCTLLQMELQLEKDARDYIDNLMMLSERAANLTKGLLAFSRNQVMRPRLVNLNDIVSVITRLTSRLIGENIEIETHLSRVPLTIRADCGQIEQMLMNLSTNARDAMPEGGRLILSTDMVKLEEGDQLLIGSNPPGTYALLSVSDTGIGMDEATIERIFEPFFSTKEQGKGTGLGLSILYGILKQHGGMVSVSSKPRFGTTFNIYLPLAESGDEASNEIGLSPPPGGSETILIAEDDAAIRTVVGHILRQFGYKVIEAADGEEAVEAFRKDAPEISLAVIDAIMPRKNSREIFDEVVRINPDIKTVFTSGYPVDLVLQRGLLPEGALFLPKPVSPMDLLRYIRQVLDEQLEG